MAIQAEVGSDMPGVGLEDFRTASLNAREREEMQVSEVEVALQSLPLRPEVQMQQDGGVLRPEREVDMPEAQAMSISPSGSLLAVGCRDGNVRVVKRDAWQTVYTVRTQGGSKGEDGGIIDIEPAVTSCAFRPENGRAASRNVLLVAKGCSVSHVHVTTGRQMAILEAPCNVNTVKFDELGERFAAGSVDATVRVYDEDTGQEQCCLSQGDGVLTSGHSNRVYGLCWPHDRPDMLLSAGWDQTVQVWDLRSGQSVRSMYGCYVCGDALDCRNDVVLTGSWRSSDPLQAWDLSKGNLLCNIPFWQRKESDTLIYGAAFGKGAAPHVILAGGSGKRPLVRLYLRSGEVVGTLETGSAVHAVEVSSNPNDPLAAICCVDKLYLLML